MNFLKLFLTLAVTAIPLIGCSESTKTATIVAVESSSPTASSKVGILLASHGSHSPQWRSMLHDLEDSVSNRVLSHARIDGIKTAFMEYTEPSIATRMREFDQEGFTDVIIVPLFLTVSSHSFDDIPTILHLKNDASALKTLQAENIERYQPKAKVTLTKELDFSGFLKDNIQRRVAALSKSPNDEGVALIAYGSAAYNTEWVELLTEIGSGLEDELGINSSSYGWCGHLVSYKADSTIAAIDQVLTNKKQALVIPVLVAYDKMFQTQIIGGAITSLPAETQARVSYIADAILPDAQLEQWIVDITASTAESLPKASHGQIAEASLQGK
ncbi:MAG: cobalamin biosynthesis protein CbiX [Planctomycetes bacterium]|nr:cobalamin biosynthesis protein CbiX [Planctomycetota bacterium]MCP4770460.1 cobalamin biosynthesis protein CbiX [Planctomycetota bacterium]MCP4859900.1 cobalamin biosynthesis protein CbiX [Planctomycetota bacterium]